MHQRNRPLLHSTRTRRLLSATLAASLCAVWLVAVTSDDPVEILCSIYDSSDAMWHLLMCWRFPAAGSAFAS